MNLEQANKILIDMIGWIDSVCVGIEIPGDKRSQMASACFDVSIEHQAAIALLSKSELYGSMLALLRSCKEAHVRGAWLSLCASEAELAQFEKGVVEKKFGVLIQEIEGKLGNNVKALSNLKAKAWRAMNDFTHTGYIQVSKRHAPGRLGSNYSDADIIGCLRVSGLLGLLSSAYLAEMAGRDDLVKMHADKASEFAKLR